MYASYNGPVCRVVPFAPFPHRLKFADPVSKLPANK
jgi:hypothetical protein